jgi:hypothetical protein
MPLAPKKQDDLKHVEIDGDEYWLKTVLGWFDVHRAGAQKGIVLHVPTGDAKRGRFFTGDDSKLMPVTLDGMEDALLDRLHLWLAKWSHEEDGKPVPLTKDNIKRMEERHVNKLMRVIEQLERGQRGPTADSPLEQPPSA